MQADSIVAPRRHVRRTERGFTLLEVIIALSILSISLVVLLQAQGAALEGAGRSRDMTVAALLLRSKMVDIEKRLFHDGFTLTTEEDDGDFRDEDHPEIKWRSRISEVKLDITSLTSICGVLPAVPGAEGKEGKGDDDGKDQKVDCEQQLMNLGTMLAPYTEELGRSMRAVELLVTWPEGRYEESMSVRTMLTRDDFNTEQETDAAKAQGPAQNTAGAAGAATGGTTAGTTTSGTTTPAVQ